nr:MAG TPA: hypothetical protein [Caudoviricetes sp.]
MGKKWIYLCHKQPSHFHPVYTPIATTAKFIHA